MDLDDQMYSDFSDLRIDPSSSSSGDRNFPIYSWQPITDQFLSSCKRKFNGVLTVIGKEFTK